MKIAAYILLPTFLIAQHLELFTISGYPVTVGLLAGLVLVAIYSTAAGWSVALLSIGIISTISFFNILITPEASVNQFARTLALIFVAIIILTSGFHGPSANTLTADGWSAAVFGSLIVVTGMSALQVFTGARGSIGYFNPFGSRQYLYEYNPYLEFNPIPRAQGFYLEPSYDAFVIGSLAVILLSLGYRTKATSTLAIAGLIATQSATGLLLLVILSLVLAIGSRGIASILSLAGGALALALTYAYLTERLDTLTTVGSSANYRLVAPIRVLLDILAHTPTGKPLGSIENVLSSYSLLNGTEVGSSLDNGYYVIVYYFGLFGLLGIAGYLFVAQASVRRQRRLVGGCSWIAPIWIAGSLNFSGGIILPEFALMLWLIIVVYRGVALDARDTADRVSGRADSFSDSGYLPRPSRTPAHPNLS